MHEFRVLPLGRMLAHSIGNQVDGPHDRFHDFLLSQGVGDLVNVWFLGWDYWEELWAVKIEGLFGVCEA